MEAVASVSTGVLVLEHSKDRWTNRFEFSWTEVVRIERVNHCQARSLQPKNRLVPEVTHSGGVFGLRRSSVDESPQPEGP
jgi:hypothetical protein